MSQIVLLQLHMFCALNFYIIYKM